MELLFLGTGAGIPAKRRNVTSIALKLLEERKSIWLFDCGEATQHQILHTSLKISKIEKIFITHLHGDHIYGLPGLLGSRSFQGGKTPLTIYGPKGIKDYVETVLRVSNTHLQYSLTIEEMIEGVIFEDEQMSVETYQLDHGIASFGFRIVEKDKPGTLKVSELKKLGIAPGPIYSQIKQGKTVEWKGEILDNASFLAADKKGKVVTILGDTRQTENIYKLAENADVLVHEATFSSEQEGMAYEYHHSTTTQAAQVAKLGNVGKLVLTHISARFHQEDDERLLQEAREIFDHTLLAQDLLTISIEGKS